ncbi:MAG TPA: c-type cytochrome [Candidatus Krumholzibacteria bacterium]|nr:c-type cytochrome [Candidatus Krumholzibacteria bacterium]
MRRTRLRHTTAVVTAVVLAAIGAAAVFRVSAVAPAVTPSQKGARLYVDKGCVQCHFLRKREFRVGPGLEGLFDRETLPASGRPATAENVRSQLVQPYDQMPSFADRLTEVQRDHLIAFLKTL